MEYKNISRQKLLNLINDYKEYCNVVRNLLPNTIQSQINSINCFFKYRNKYIHKTKYANYLDIEIHEITHCYQNVEEQGRVSNNKIKYDIIELLKNNNSLTQKQIAEHLNRTENCIYRNIKNLKEKNILIRIGSNKNGYWKLSDKFSNNCMNNFDEFEEFINN